MYEYARMRKSVPLLQNHRAAARIGPRSDSSRRVLGAIRPTLGRLQVRFRVDPTTIGCRILPPARIHPSLPASCDLFTKTFVEADQTWPIPTCMSVIQPKDGRSEPKRRRFRPKSRRARPKPTQTWSIPNPIWPGFGRVQPKLRRFKAKLVEPTQT